MLSSFLRLAPVVLAALMLLVGPATAQQKNPERNAYFGETHIHTSWSMDAWLFGNHLTGPAEALQYAQGQPIKHPLGYQIRIETPLDWMGVTEHSEYVGVTREANRPGSTLSKLPEAQSLILKNPNDPAEVQKVFLALLKIMGQPPIQAFMSPEVAGSIWKQGVKIADENNRPGKFTAFCAYEFTSNFNNRGLHRNIFFRSNKVPDMPFTSLDSWHPEDLWKWMDAQRKAGCELLAISHNANLSDGWMYPTDLDSMGRPIDAAWAAARTRNERLVEMKQIKGQSETHPLLSPNDEFANYEIVSFLIGLPLDSGRLPHIVGSYTRQALKDGLTMMDAKGFNPYKFGFVSGSDSHNSAAPYRQGNFYGGHGLNDGTIETRMAGHLVDGLDMRLESPAGLTAVWAEENTRASLWDAMYRKETFATSGPRIKLRFFGAWNYKPALLNAAGWVKAAYAGGVPMGGDLPPASGKAPTFVVWAVKDPTSGNLDRIQVVKGWSKNGQSFEKIFDVAWSGGRKPEKWTGRIPAVTSTVNVDDATYANTVGSTELKATWTDPEFDPALHAFYYARVLEIPTPRWSTMEARKLGVAPPNGLPACVQERAWSSPIWYTPTAEARKGATPGLTVSALVARGAVALDDQQMKALIVGKAVWYRNTVTGELLEILFDADGTSLILRAGNRTTLPSAVGALPLRSYTGVPTPYSIKDGKFVSMIGTTPMTMSLYRVGDKVYGARSNEFGYANYELLPKGPDDLIQLKQGQDGTPQPSGCVHPSK